MVTTRGVTISPAGALVGASAGAPALDALVAVLVVLTTFWNVAFNLSEFASDCTTWKEGVREPQGGVKEQT